MTVRVTLVQQILNIFYGRDNNVKNHVTYESNLCKFGCMYVNDIDVKIPGIVNEMHIDKIDIVKTSQPMSVLIVERDIRMV